MLPKVVLGFPRPPVGAGMQKLCELLRTTPRNEKELVCWLPEKVWRREG